MPKVLLAFLLLFSGAACQSQQPATREVVLPSKRKIRVIAVGQIQFTNGSAALMLQYETDLKVSNIAELRKEVEEIWVMFRPEVEKAKLTVAIIRATEVPQGLFLKSANGYGFVYQRVADGTWQLQTDAKK